MKRPLVIGFIVATAFTSPVFAKDYNELNVGDVACIDVFGPWNKVGTIISKRSSSQEILLRDSDGKEKWYPAKKTRNVTGCKVTGEAASYLLQKGIESAVSN